MIKIPEKFIKILSKDEKLYSEVNYLLNGELYDILKMDQLDFFPEYTNHSIEHINKVLEYIDNLILTETYQLLRPAEVAVIILSTFFHDLGMHISVDGFYKLLDKKKVPTNIDNNSWKELWIQFQINVNKYSDKELIRIFGEVRRADKFPENSIDIRMQDRLLAGEFLRIHHPRLAQEIACDGFPGGMEVITVKEYFSEFNRELVEMAGFVARSHGMALRDTFDYLDDMYSRIKFAKPYGIHIIYIMALLRIADYLDVGSERAPQVFNKWRNTLSISSKDEWRWNQAVKSELIWEEAEEQVYVIAEPSDSKIYLRIKEWLEQVQGELDTSWAVLGQVYGIRSNTPQIKIRRIGSNILDNKEKYKSSFHPDYMHYDSHPDMFKLTIGPTYDENPSYAVRELLQNAVDSCNAREFLMEEKEYAGEITISIESHNNGYTFRIVDNGIGMDIETIKNYYLISGASFRRSYEFLNIYTDDEGKPLIMRNGRFGVGALAAFLLGNTVKVTTRKMGEDSGYYFSAYVDEEQIDVRTVDVDHIGTEIEVVMSQYTYKVLMESPLEWNNWYHLNRPQIKYLINGVDREPKGLTYYEQPCWYRIDDTGFDEVYYTFDIEHFSDVRGEGPILIYNGFLIPFGYSDHRFEPKTIELQWPAVYIYDKGWDINLSLNRNIISGKLPFYEKLCYELIKHKIYKIISQEPINLFSQNHQEPRLGSYGKWEIDATFYGDDIKRSVVIPHNYVFAETGFFPLQSAFLRYNEINTITLIMVKRDEGYDYTYFDFFEKGVNIVISQEFEFNEEQQGDYDRLGLLNHMVVKDNRIIAVNKELKKYWKIDTKRGSYCYGSEYKDYMILDSTTLYLDEYKDYLEFHGSNVWMIMELTFDHEILPNLGCNHEWYEDLFAEKLIQKPCIFPYDIHGRKHKAMNLVSCMENIKENDIHLLNPYKTPLPITSAPVIEPAYNQGAESLSISSAVKTFE